MSRVVIAGLLFGLIACTPTTKDTTGDLALLGPYREPNDQCRWVSPTDDTTPFLKEGTDLVACPGDYDGTQIFIADVDAVEAGRMNGWILYHVPQPWRG